MLNLKTSLNEGCVIVGGFACFDSINHPMHPRMVNNVFCWMIAYRKVALEFARNTEVLFNERFVRLA